MLTLTVIGMLALFFVAYRLSGNLLYPAVVFNGTWFLTLLAILIAGDTYFPLTPVSCLVFLMGALAISLGGLLALQFSQTRAGYAPTSAVTSRRNCRYRRIAMDCVLIIVLIATPLYWRAVSSLVGDVAPEMMLQYLRNLTVEAGDKGESLGLIANVVVLAQFLAAAMFFESDGTWSRRWRTSVAVGAALVLGAMSGTKGNAVTLILTLLLVSALKTRRLRVATVSLITLVALAIFSVGLLVVNFAEQNLLSDFGAASGVIGENVAIYWVGGVVAFSRISENPQLIESTQKWDRFFLETARSIGAHVKLPGFHADYTMIGPGIDTNVYTIYFTYFKDPGWFGMISLMLILGFVLTLICRRAMLGSAFALQIYAQLCVGLVLSFSSEHFLLGLNGYIKASAFFLFLYWFLPALEQLQTQGASARD